jgi:hypothetical protein
MKNIDRRIAYSQAPALENDISRPADGLRLSRYSSPIASGMSDTLPSGQNGHFTITSWSTVALQKQDSHSAKCRDCLCGSTTAEFTACTVTYFGSALIFIANK